MSVHLFPFILLTKALNFVKTAAFFFFFAESVVPNQSRIIHKDSDELLLEVKLQHEGLCRATMITRMTFDSR